MTRTAITLIAFLAFLPMISTGADANEQRPIEETIVVYGANADDEAAIRWALQRFEDSGIPLPALEIVKHDSPAGCDGHAGLFTPRESIDRIDLCNVKPFIVLHELGHAWEMNFARQDARDALMESFGDARWDGIDADSRERGAERAASVLAVGLIDAELNDAGANLNRRLLDRFKLLTGVDSPRYKPDNGAND